VAIPRALKRTVSHRRSQSRSADIQAASETAVRDLFDAFDHSDALLGDRRFLTGGELVLADVFPFPPSIGSTQCIPHFKCSIERLTDIENLWPYARDVYQLDGVGATCNMDHVKAHYYRSHEGSNPRGFVPVGPTADWSAPRGRANLGSRSNYSRI